jgi:hypothetical protein
MLEITNSDDRGKNVSLLIESAIVSSTANIDIEVKRNYEWNRYEKYSFLS